VIRRVRKDGWHGAIFQISFDQLVSMLFLLLPPSRCVGVCAPLHEVARPKMQRTNSIMASLCSVSSDWLESNGRTVLGLQAEKNGTLFDYPSHFPCSRSYNRRQDTCRPLLAMFFDGRI